MTALDLVRRIRANPKGSDFQDVKHVEEFVTEEISRRQFNIKCETKSDKVTGTTNLPVIRTEIEDDNSITIVTNHWPKT